jgi:hypothetical protein
MTTGRDTEVSREQFGADEIMFKNVAWVSLLLYGT